MTVEEHPMRHNSTPPMVFLLPSTPSATMAEPPPLRVLCFNVLAQCWVSDYYDHIKPGLMDSQARQSKVSEGCLWYCES